MIRKIFSTDDVRPEDRFRNWREIREDRLIPMSQDRLGDQPFQATILGADIGGLAFSQFALSDVRAVTTPRTMRHPNNKTDQLFLSMVLSGSVRAAQNDRSTINRTGDLCIRDTNSPWAIEHQGSSDALAVQIPRRRLEGMLGSARLFADMTLQAHLPTTALSRSFLLDLVRMEEQLTPEAARRMASVGVDLVVAGIAERMALDAPRSLHATLTVQRAKAFVEANLGDVELDPAQVAAAAGVSPRHLHSLFRQQGRSVAAWIWQRRLEAIAHRLFDPACRHMSLREIAYRCGFASQSHFSRRFRDRYGVSPRDYRRGARSDRHAPL